MNAVALDGGPCLVADGPVLLGFEQSVPDAPAHAVEKQCRACKLLALIVVRHQAHVPQAVLALARGEGLAHHDEVFFEFLVVLVFLADGLHHADQCRVHPSVAAAPVAILAVGLFVGRHVVFVAEPESVAGVEQSASAFVACPTVTLHGIVHILALAGELVHHGIERHGHLYGVYPCPVVMSSGGHLVVEVLPEVAQQLFLRLPRIGQQLDIGLPATLVVGIGGAYAVARCPLMEIGPCHGVVDISLLRVYGLQGHETLVVHGAGPQAARSLLLDEGGTCGIGILGHEVIVGFSGRGHDVVGRLSHHSHRQEQECGQQ